MLVAPPRSDHELRRSDMLVAPRCNGIELQRSDMLVAGKRYSIQSNKYLSSYSTSNRSSNAMYSSLNDRRA